MDTPQWRAAERPGRAARALDGQRRYFALISVLQDPVYLTEPLIRTITWRRDPGYQIGSYTCHATAEVEHPKGYVPFNLPGHNAMLRDNLPAEWNLPEPAIRGGSETLLPEYAEELKSHISAGAD
jgi:hypothetical protein